MDRNIHKGKTNQPHSLLALSIEAAAEDYRFDPRDLFSYHRDIDFTELHAGALTKLDFGVSYVSKLPRWLLRRLSEKMSTFLEKRRTNIHKLFTELASKIVNFDNVGEIDKVEKALGYGVSPLPKLRQKYVEYAQQMVDVENLGIRVNKGNQLHKLLICIQRERLFLKQGSRKLRPEYYAGGDGDRVKDDNSTEIYDKHCSKADKSMEVFESRNPGQMFEVTNVRTGEKTVYGRPRSDPVKQVLLEDQNNCHIQRQYKATGHTQSSNDCDDDDDDDEGIVLYGMICA